MKKFVEVILGKLTGNKDQQLAEGNHKQAATAIKVELMGTEIKIDELTEAVKDAEEAVNHAKYPTKKIDATEDGRASYIHGIVAAKRNLASAKQKLSDYKEWREDLEAIRVELDLEVDSTTANQA